MSKPAKPVSLQDQRDSIETSKIKLGGAKAFDALYKNKFNGETLLANTRIGDDKSDSLKTALSAAAATAPALVKQFEADLNVCLSQVSIRQALTDYNTIHKALCDALTADPTPQDFDILALPAYLAELKKEFLDEVKTIYDQQKQDLEKFLDGEITTKPTGLLALNTHNIGGLDPQTVKQKILASFEENHKKICDAFDKNTDKDSINNAIENLTNSFIAEASRIDMINKLKEAEAAWWRRATLTAQIDEQHKKAIASKNAETSISQGGDDYKGIDITKLTGLKTSCGYPFESLARRFWANLPSLPTKTEPSFKDIVSNTEQLVLQMLAAGADPIHLKITLEDSSNQDLAKYLTRVAIAACMRAGVDPTKIVITAPQATSQSASATTPTYTSQVVCGKVSDTKTISAQEAYDNTMHTGKEWRWILPDRKAYPMKEGWKFQDLEKQNQEKRDELKKQTQSDQTDDAIKEAFKGFKQHALAAQTPPPGTTAAQGQQASTGAANTATVSVSSTGPTRP